jgi:hypothetical protein
VQLWNEYYGEGNGGKNVLGIPGGVHDGCLATK